MSAQLSQGIKVGNSESYMFVVLGSKDAFQSCEMVLNYICLFDKMQRLTTENEFPVSPYLLL